MVFETAIIALMASNAIASYYTGMSQARMQGKYYGFMSDMADQSGALAIKSGEQQAEMSQEEGMKLSSQLQDKLRLVEASQKSAEITQGIDLSSVTAEDISRDNLSRYTVDQMLVKYNADLKSYEAKRNARLQAMGYFQQAASGGLSGQLVQTATRIGASASLLSGAANTAYAGYSMSKYGGNSNAKAGGQQTGLYDYYKAGPSNYRSESLA